MPGMYSWVSRGMFVVPKWSAGILRVEFALLANTMTNGSAHDRSHVRSCAGRFDRTVLRGGARLLHRPGRRVGVNARRAHRRLGDGGKAAILHLLGPTEP